MTKFTFGNLLLGASILLATTSQVIIKKLMSELDGGGLWASVSQLLAADKVWRAALAGTMVVGGFLCWVACLAKLDLSYAYTIACGSALLVAFFSAVFLGEQVTWRIWVGTVFIVIGTAFLAPSATPVAPN